MKITRVVVNNYRNLKNVDVKLGNIVTIIGENNSGKSNLLRAISLPFFADEIGYLGKNLSWSDINNEARESYYKFILENKESITNGSIDLSDFENELPIISVQVTLKPKENELYDVRDICYGFEEDESILYGILYEFKAKSSRSVYECVKNILENETINNVTINQFKMNLLPTELYSYSISVPNKGKISYDTLKMFKYSALMAERDDFSNSSERLGSKSLVKLLQMKIDTKDKLAIEKQYFQFFEMLKGIGDMDNIINWQDNSDYLNAQEFFKEISILPNMPPMNSILNSVRLGYSGDSLSSQGLGYRNLILILVLLNSLVIKEENSTFNVITLEEPEAHLCINNIKLLISFIKNYTDNNEYFQLFYTTHNTEFINKLDLKNVIILNNGNAYALSSYLEETELDYLTKNPNLDLFKLFFSRRCILVEGLTEELLIKSYLDSRKELNDIEVISFHKGFSNIMNIWLKLNSISNNKLGIIRDFDNQENAQILHEKYNKFSNICVRTTKEYTLEPEIVNTGKNYNVLVEKYGEVFGWKSLSYNELANNWRSSKSSVMLQICKDLTYGDLKEFQMPTHIQEVIDFLMAKKESHGN